MTELAIQLPARAFAGLLCMQTHPIALMLGTIGPWNRCCADCRLVPPGPPTSWTFPA